MIDHWWQTETGWPVGCNCVGLGLLPVKPGSCAVPVPGYDVRVLTDEGAEVRPGDTGNVVIKLPLPPGCSPTLWNNDQGYRDTYLSAYPGYYLTADAGLQGRGRLPLDHEPHRRRDQRRRATGLSTGAMEEVLAAHPDVAECAVVGVSRRAQRRGPARVWWCSRRGPIGHGRSWSPELVELVRQRIGPVASFKTATHGQAAAQDPIRQDRSRDHQEDRRWRALHHPAHDRRSRDPRRDLGRSGGDRVSSGRQSYGSGSTCNSTTGLTESWPVNGRSCDSSNRMHTAIAVENSPSAIRALPRLSLCTRAMVSRVQIA